VTSAHGDLLRDLDAEHAALDAVVAPLDDAGWDRPTPSPGWRVRDQIGHLTYFDQMAHMAAIDPSAFEIGRDRALADPAAFAEEATSIGRDATGADLLDIWRLSRAAMLDAFRDFPADGRVIWYGPPMSTKSFLTARLMETWAHGQDVVDAVDGNRPATDRLQHICHLGFITRGWSYMVRGQQARDEPVRVELTLPSGAAWSAGDDTAADRISGPAEDFCLVVTQRRNVADTALVVEGEAADEWMSIAQCFAGGPTLPPPPMSA